jgi:hypothetical protein
MPQIKGPNLKEIQFDSKEHCNQQMQTLLNWLYGIFTTIKWDYKYPLRSDSYEYRHWN